MRVIAKAYGDQPLDRVTAGEDADVVFVVNPRVNREDEEAQSTGVGFPKACVYEYSDSLFAALEAAWSANDETALRSLWNQASPMTAHASRG